MWVCRTVRVCAAGYPSGWPSRASAKGRSDPRANDAQLRSRSNDRREAEALSPDAAAPIKAHAASAARAARRSDTAQEVSARTAFVVLDSVIALLVRPSDPGYPARRTCTDIALPLKPALALISVEVDHPSRRQAGDANVVAPALRARHRLHLLALKQPVQVHERLFEPLPKEVPLGYPLLPVGQ
jgi:hypothetical protein